MDDGRDDENITAHTCSPAPVITVDFEKYAHHLEGMDLSEDQAAELLQALWNIACEFVALGFEVHPVQQAEKACGKNARTRGNQPVPRENEVSLLGEFIRENIIENTDLKADRTGEGVEND